MEKVEKKLWERSQYGGTIIVVFGLALFPRQGMAGRETFSMWMISTAQK